MDTQSKKIGLIAGNGQFPLIFARMARLQGYNIVAIALQGEAEDGLEDLVDKFYPVKIGYIKEILAIFKREEITEAVFAGQVRHVRLFEGLQVDPLAAKLLQDIKDKRADTILSAFAGLLENMGVKLIDSTKLLADYLPDEGVITQTKPTPEQQKDIEFGYNIAKNIAGLDIGQTIVVKKGVVVAVEALEGTDAAIERGGILAKGDIVVIKVSKPDQDKRFDVPVIGQKTIDILKEAKANVLAFSANETLLLQKDEIIKSADEAGICLIAIK